MADRPSYLDFTRRSDLVGKTHRPGSRWINHVSCIYMVNVKVESIVGPEALKDDDVRECVGDYVSGKDDWEDMSWVSG
jgi:hypothetical protein